MTTSIDRAASDDMETIAITQMLHKSVGNLFQMKIKTVLHVLVKTTRNLNLVSLIPPLKGI